MLDDKPNTMATKLFRERLALLSAGWAFDDHHAKHILALIASLGYEDLKTLEDFLVKSFSRAERFDREELKVLHLSTSGG